MDYLAPWLHELITWEAVALILGIFTFRLGTWLIMMLWLFRVMMMMVVVMSMMLLIKVHKIEISHSHATTVRSSSSSTTTMAAVMTILMHILLSNTLTHRHAMTAATP
jgi:hypothetical protein